MSLAQLISNHWYHFNASPTRLPIQPAKKRHNLIKKRPTDSFFLWEKVVSVSEEAWDACVPSQNTTLFFAYSNDFHYQTINELAIGLDDIFQNSNISRKYSTLGNVVFDSVMDGFEFFWHTNHGDFTKSIRQNLPNPLLGYDDKKTPSNVVDMLKVWDSVGFWRLSKNPWVRRDSGTPRFWRLRKLLDSKSSEIQVILKIHEFWMPNSDTVLLQAFLNHRPICGSTILLALKRNTNETELSSLLKSLQHHHISIFTLGSDELYGSASSKSMYDLSSKSNGMFIFNKEEEMDVVSWGKRWWLIADSQELITGSW